MRLEDVSALPTPQSPSSPPHVLPHSSNTQELLASRLTEALSEGEVERSLTSSVGMCPTLQQDISTDGSVTQTSYPCFTECRL